ncbi:MAG: NAD-dependent epimerase/dehydratase family protein [Gemmatimonadota bacterium]
MTSGVPSLPRSRAPQGDVDLEERLSRPTAQVLDALRAAPGDILVLGAGGKMGPSLAAMAQRAVLTLGDGRSVYAVSRWGNAADANRLERMGVRIIRADLLELGALDALPDAPTILYLAGQKFGTRDAPALTWMTNTILPSRAVARYRNSRFAAFSTGNVYALTSSRGGGSREDDPLAPVGEYAASCVGRERIFEDAAHRWGTPSVLLRLNYAVDLRYGVLVDLARRLLDDEAIDLAMGYVNCIWQGDANATALSALPHASSPPFALNVTGTERLSVRRVALQLAERLSCTPRFVGEEREDALLSDTGRAQQLFDPHAVDAATLIDWVADWLLAGGRTLGKATRFERRDGSF